MPYSIAKHFHFNQFKIGRLASGIVSIIASVTLLLSSCTTTSVLSLSSSSSSQATNLHDEPIVALVLGGGGAKGLAHVGVIKALETNGITPNLIVGSSVGSLVGSIYASGKSADELEHLALTTTEDELTDFTLSHQGFIEGEKLRAFVNTQVADRNIEELPIRFAAVATAKNTSQKTVFTSGETGLIVQASSSVPNLFIAPRIPDKVGRKYIDGGVSSMVPVDTARALGADVIIAVDVMPSDADMTTQSHGHSQNILSLMDEAYSQSDEYPQYSAAPILAEVDRADIIIRPNVSEIATFDTTRRQQAIDAGQRATLEQMPAIKQALDNISLSVQ